jgi:hypothetical protein
MSTLNYEWCTSTSVWKVNRKSQEVLLVIITFKLVIFCVYVGQLYAVLGTKFHSKPLHRTDSKFDTL